MYFPDFSEYGLLTYQGRNPYTLKEAFNIGWLENGHSYQRGDVATKRIAKIKHLLCLEKTNINVTRGVHKCDFCGASQQLVHYGKEVVLGISELWIPSATSNVVFACPTLVIHYIETHHYQPPLEFLQAVDNFDTEAPWDGSQVFELLRKKYYPSVNGA